MQFSDRVQIESGPFHLYGPYGSTTRETPFTLASYADVLRLVTRSSPRTGGTRDKPKNFCVGGYLHTGKM